MAHSALVTTPANPESGRLARMERTNRVLRIAQEHHGCERQSLLNEAIQLNVPVALSIARRFGNRGESLEDLEQVACLGLAKAVRRYDPSRVDDFLSYAVPSITGEIKRYFRDSAWTVRPPRRIQELQGEMWPAIQTLTQRLGRTPNASEIAEELGRDVDDVSEALACDGCFSPTSLDSQVAGSDGYSLVDHLGEEDRGLERVEALTMVAQACKGLAPRDRRILYLRFIKDLTQEQIGLELGITQTQVSRLISRIIGQLRDNLEPPGPDRWRDLQAG